MVDILPPDKSIVSSANITADIPYLTTIIPVDQTALFKLGQVVRVLDDIRPPVITKILSINETSNPKFIISYIIC